MAVKGCKYQRAFRPGSTVLFLLVGSLEGHSHGTSPSLVDALQPATWHSPFHLPNAFHNPLMYPRKKNQKPQAGIYNPHNPFTHR
jgi:hypothetical protein